MNDHSLCYQQENVSVLLSFTVFCRVYLRSGGWGMRMERAYFGRAGERKVEESDNVCGGGVLGAGEEEKFGVGEGLFRFAKDLLPNLVLPTVKIDRCISLETESLEMDGFGTGGSIKSNGYIGITRKRDA